MTKAFIGNQKNKVETRVINNRVARFFLVNLMAGLIYSAFIGSDYINPSKIHHPKPGEFLSLAISLVLTEILHLTSVIGYMGFYCFKEKKSLRNDILCFLASVLSIGINHLLFSYWLNNYPK